MLYLAQPYSHPDKSIRYMRYRQGMAAAALLLAQGEHVYAPIVSWHEVACHHALPEEFEFWWQFNLDMIERCDRLAMLLLSDWKSSEGMRAETEFAFITLLPGSIDALTLTPSNTIIRRQNVDLSILGEFICGKDHSQ